MKMQWKLMSIFLATIITFSTLISASIFFLLNSYKEKEISRYRNEQVTTVKEELQNYVEIAISALDSAVSMSEVSESRQETISKALAEVGSLRYDHGEGYFWINDTTLPIPSMVMHPIAPSLNGKVMDDPKYNCAMGKNQNLFQAFAEVSSREGQGFVDYLWPKPGESDPQPKLSFVKTYAPLNWIIGTGVYIDNIEKDVIHKSKEIGATVSSVFKTILLINVVIIVLMVAGIKFFSDLVIVRPLIRVISFMEKVAGGNLHASLQVAGQDEVSHLARSLNSMAGKLNRMFKGINSNAGTLDLTSTDVLDLSEKLALELDGMSTAAATVSSAAKEMNANMISISAAMEQSSTNAITVAHSVEEIKETIDGIAKNSENARMMTDGAVHKAQAASKRINELSQAAEEISTVTETITAISEKTNLLALNATIEAARAGEAGKGFAVVANEIKELANQTAQATLDIKARINGVQSSTGDTVGDIEEVGQVINEINLIVSDIAAAVDEQSSTTAEITENISQVSNGIQDVNTSVSQATDTNRSITGDITNLTKVADQFSISSMELKGFAQDLNSIAHYLSEVVQTFDLGEMRFDIAATKRAHLLWKKNLTAVLQGKKKIEPDEVSHYTKCDFGKWYFGKGQTFSGMPVFVEMGGYHEQVHTLARQIVELYNAGNKDKAHALLRDFEEVRIKMFDCLDELYTS